MWVPDPHHEAVRDLTRARGAAVREQRAKRQQVSALLLRLGPHYPGKTTWGKAHMAWLAGQKLGHLEPRIALEEMLHAVRQAGDRIARLEQAIHAAVPDWSLAPSATALMALRGIEFIAATTLLADAADRALSGAAPGRQARCRCHHRGGAGIGGVHLGGWSGGRLRQDAGGVADRQTNRLR